MRITAAALLSAMLAAPATAQEPASFNQVEFVPEAGTTLQVGDRSYEGTLRIVAAPNGLVLVEDVGIDGYLSGIREVPLSWHPEALAAQVVAARTYLAWTLDRGRSSEGVRYGFDICATTSCQVYAGVGVVRGPDGDRWASAIERTAGEVLLYEGKPAQAMYHSTSGGRTEPIEDIFASTPKPYLAGAESPGEPSPYVDWSYEIPAHVFVEALRDVGAGVGSTLIDVAVVPREIGEGQWTVRVESSTGVTEFTVNRIRSIMNSFGPKRYPGLLPATRPGGGRYPQAVLSYRYNITYTPPPGGHIDLNGMVPESDLPVEGSLLFEGNGWGHHVGMSQYGALALAEAGTSYPDVLAHFYGGLTPSQASDTLPEVVTVGLAWGRDEIALSADGPVDVVTDSFATQSGAGIWLASFGAEGDVALVAPDRILEQRLARLLVAIPVF